MGDSPNDAPMFAFFRNACGVSSVRRFAGRLEAEPGYVTEGGGGRGFIEVADRLLAARRGGAPERVAWPLSHRGPRAPEFTRVSRGRLLGDR